MDGISTWRPALKRPPGWPAEGKQADSVDPGGEIAQGRDRPSIQWISDPGIGRHILRQMRPDCRTGIADQQQLACRRILLQKIGVGRRVQRKTTAQQQAQWLQQLDDFHGTAQTHGKAPLRQSDRLKRISPSPSPSTKADSWSRHSWKT